MKSSTLALVFGLLCIVLAAVSIGTINANTQLTQENQLLNEQITIEMEKTIDEQRQKIGVMNELLDETYQNIALERHLYQVKMAFNNLIIVTGGTEYVSNESMTSIHYYPQTLIGNWEGKSWELKTKAGDEIQIEVRDNSQLVATVYSVDIIEYTFTTQHIVLAEK
jgi:hypothetical protein